jgi:hypothetical protein
MTEKRTQVQVRWSFVGSELTLRKNFVHLRRWLHSELPNTDFCARMSPGNGSPNVVVSD